MKILALESSAESCSVALSDGHQDYIQVRHEPRQHAKLFLPLVQSVLDQSGLTLSELDGIAFGRGPGSFTGLRICMSVVQGLAFGAGLSVIPVSTLQALAFAAQRVYQLPQASRVVAGFDARMSEVYFGHYELTESRPKLLEPECVIGLEIATSRAQVLKDSSIFVGSAWSIEVLSEFSNPSHRELSVTAEDILGLAKMAYSNNEVISVEDAEPVYLRDDVAWEKRVRIRTENLI